MKTGAIVLVVFCGIVLAGALSNADAEGEPKPNPPIAKEEPASLAREAEIQFSDGSVLRGEVFLRGSRKIKVFDKANKRFREIPLALLKRIEIEAIREEKQDEWRWLENASDAKVRTGHFYWRHQYETTLVLHKGEPIVGAVRGPIYVSGKEGVERFILHDRRSGKRDAPLEDLVFIRKIDFEPRPATASQPASRPASRPADSETGNESADQPFDDPDAAL